MLVRHTCGELFTVLPNRFLCPPTDTSRWALQGHFAKHLNAICQAAFRDNYGYQDDSATPHHARVVLDFLQQGNVTNIEQPARSPDCNSIEHIWDELGRAIISESITESMVPLVLCRSGSTNQSSADHIVVNSYNHTSMAWCMTPYPLYMMTMSYTAAFITNVNGQVSGPKPWIIQLHWTVKTYFDFKYM